MEGKILAAVSDPEIAESVGLYSIMLAKRTGMEACMLMVRGVDGVRVKSGHEAGDGLYEKARRLIKTGEEEGVKVECLITEGVFEDVVADQIKERGSTIVVVGTDLDVKARRERLRRIEKGLQDGGGLGEGQLPQFLIVAKRGTDEAAEEASVMHGAAGKKR